MMQMPKGLLYVKVLEAQDVPNMDWFSKTDAYVRLFIHGRRKRFTEVAWNDLNPRHVQYQQQLLFTNLTSLADKANCIVQSYSRKGHAAHP